MYASIVSQRLLVAPRVPTRQTNQRIVCRAVSRPGGMRGVAGEQDLRLLGVMSVDNCLLLREHDVCNCMKGEKGMNEAEVDIF